MSSFNEALLIPQSLRLSSVTYYRRSWSRCLISTSQKACGPDNISNEHIIFGGPYLTEIITLLFLLSGFIHPVSDMGLSFQSLKIVTSNPSNYRGISLLSSLSKLFEKLLLLYLDDLHASLNPLQGGFRRGVSCLHTSFIFQEAVASLRDKKKKAFVAFIDVKKAFDTVWHPGLMMKLHNKKLQPYLWHLIQSWYSSMSSSVLWYSNISRKFSLQQGVRQGSILSPLLYSIFLLMTSWTNFVTPV